MRYVPGSLFILFGLSIMVYGLNETNRKIEEKSVFTHQAPKMIRLSETSADADGRYSQYLKDRTTGLCFIEIHHDPILIPSCEAIPSFKSEER